MIERHVHEAEGMDKCRGFIHIRRDAGINIAAQGIPHFPKERFIGEAIMHAMRFIQHLELEIPAHPLYASSLLDADIGEEQGNVEAVESPGNFIEIKTEKPQKPPERKGALGFSPLSFNTS